jgi:hypothetical protein
MFCRNHRTIDAEKSRDNRPFRPYVEDDRVSPRQLVKPEIGLWPFEAISRRARSWY